MEEEGDTPKLYQINSKTIKKLWNKIQELWRHEYEDPTGVELYKHEYYDLDDSIQQYLIKLAVLLDQQKRQHEVGVLQWQT